MVSQHRFAILAKFANTSSKFHAFVGDNLNWVQVTDRGTAAVERRALAEASSVDVSAGAYRFKVRLVTSDAASSNLALERELSHERGPRWVTLHLQCNVHKARLIACVPLTTILSGTWHATRILGKPFGQHTVGANQSNIDCAEILAPSSNMLLSLFGSWGCC